ncbi:hypothetical protein EB061_05565 [bacterium]|nr:hypothetical protein [bacterium]
MEKNMNKVEKIMKLRTGAEAEIDGLVWFRIDSSEFKVHEPDNPDGPETCWVPRDREAVAIWFE